MNTQNTQNVENQMVETLAIGTKVKFINGNINFPLNGTIVDVRILGKNYIQYLFSEIYGDHNQHECLIWLTDKNIVEIIK